jgi:carbamoyl-phosphate synthase large subunit
VDHIKNGEIHLVINTVGDKASQMDSASLRRAALVQNVAYQTTLAGARAVVMAIEAGLKRKPTVKPLQGYYA